MSIASCPHASREEVLQVLKELVSSRLATDLSDLDEFTVIARLHVDSLDQAELMIAIEETFSISLEEEESSVDLASLSLGRLADLIWEKIK